MTSCTIALTGAGSYGRVTLRRWRTNGGQTVGELVAVKTSTCQDVSVARRELHMHMAAGRIADGWHPGIVEVYGRCEYEASEDCDGNGPGTCGLPQGEMQLQIVMKYESRWVFSYVRSQLG